jgi:hypothetical protein
MQSIDILIVIFFDSVPRSNHQEARSGVIQNDAMRFSAYEKTAPSQTFRAAFSLETM